MQTRSTPLCAFPPRPPHLQGKTLDQTLKEALQPVPNPHSDSGIAQLNRIRESLRLIAANSTAVGLPQASMGCAAQAVVWLPRGLLRADHLGYGEECPFAQRFPPSL